MTTTSSQRNLALLLEELEIPASAYERADRRYQSLGEFFGSDRAHSARYSPHIYPQGSFRLGTVIRPLDNGEYDIDIGCRLRHGISKDTHTQKQLKELVGADMERYRLENGIESPLDEKRRCWRLAYRDEIAFHMDVVPSIPEGVGRRQMLQERMRAAGLDITLAARVAQHAGAITDNQLLNYEHIQQDWKISNSEGFALWFESRMRQAQLLLERNAAQVGATTDQLPARRWNSPLQAAIRILKRHRDVMYRGHTDSQPISVIITTLAALAYQGEADLEATLAGVLDRMETFVRASSPRVPNPVNPEEDFADKWSEANYAHLQLEANFRRWLAQAQADFANLRRATTVTLLEATLGRFGVTPGKDQLAKAVGAGAAFASAAPATVEPASRPWA
jgi:hypothetical protein